VSIGTTTSDAATTTTITTTIAPTTTEAPTSTSTTVDVVAATDAVRKCVNSWPLADRIGLLVWPAVYSSDWASAVAHVRELGLGGVILMKPSDDFAASLASHLHELDAVARHGLLVATDEEGGRVQRLAALDPIPSEEAMSQLSKTERDAILARHAKIVAAAGVDVVLGPVVDVRPVTGKDPLGGGRLFLGDGEAVAGLAKEYVAAWEAAGILPVLKHYPGHGSASGDTHTKLATTPSLAALEQRDFVPYRGLAASGAGVMVGHLNVPGLTAGLPASLSPKAIALLRGELGFANSIVVTDSLGMGAIGMSIEDAAVAAVKAGADVVIFTTSSAAKPVVDTLLAAVADGRLSNARVTDAATRVAGELARHGTACRPAA
jgi:beta-N-acetylhexosaminidase